MGLFSNNLGNRSPGPVVGGITPSSVIQRELLVNPKPLSIAHVQEVMDNHKCEGGGALPAGLGMYFASPAMNGDEDTPGAFVYESDRFGGSVRVPGEVRPQSTDMIMGSNHFLNYGYWNELNNIADPVVFGQPVVYRVFMVLTFQVQIRTVWRYKAGVETLEAWNRAKLPLGTPEMVRMMQTVNQNTEHSVIVRVKGGSKEVEFDVANSHLLPARLWDAPYQNWTTITFSEAFNL